MPTKQVLISGRLPLDKNKREISIEESIEQVVFNKLSAERRQLEPRIVIMPP